MIYYEERANVDILMIDYGIYWLIDHLGHKFEWVGKVEWVKKI